MFVQIVKVPGGSVKGYDLPVGSTVADVIKAADLEVGKLQIQIDGEPADLTDEVMKGQTVMLIPGIKGNK